jgi:hypothetical protein
MQLCQADARRAPNGIRTRAAALKGRCPRPLDDGGSTDIAALPVAPAVGDRPSIGDERHCRQSGRRGACACGSAPGVYQALYRLASGSGPVRSSRLPPSGAVHQPLSDGLGVAFFGHKHPAHHVGERAEAGEQGQDGDDHSDNGRVYLEVVGQPGADARYPATLTFAFESARRGRAVRPEAAGAVGLAWEGIGPGPAPPASLWTLLISTMVPESRHRR